MDDIYEFQANLGFQDPYLKTDKFFFNVLQGEEVEMM